MLYARAIITCRIGSKFPHPRLRFSVGWVGLCRGRYKYTCCSCPTGYAVLTTGNCDEGAECVGCTLKNETLTKDKGDGGCSCVLK